MKYLVLIMFAFILASVYALNNMAYGVFDSRGRYYCDPKNIGLEETIYKAAVTRFNDEVDSYLSLNPSATYQQLRSNVIHTTSGTTEPTYDIVSQSQACLLSSGINPLSFATPVSLSSTNGYAPEFGPLAGLIIAMSITGVIFIKKLGLTFPKIIHRD